MKDVIVIPTYNESKNIIQIITEIFKLLPKIFILVVDDNSPDGTAGIVKNLEKDYPNLSLLLRNKKEGLGRAYINAFEEILKDKNVKKIVTMDADFSHNPQYLTKMLKAAESSDVVIGSRYIRGGKTKGWELWRRILSRGANFYCRLVIQLPIFDYTSGFNIINADFLRKIDFSKIDVSGYAFLIELKYLLWKENASLKEIPILLKNRRGGESKIASHIIEEGILAPWKMIFKKTNKNCPLCKKETAVFFTKKNSCNVYKCKNCSLIFVLPLSENHLEIYSQDYFSGAKKGFGYVDYDIDKKAMSSALNSYLDKIEKFIPKTGKILDVGAATGFFIKLAEQRGWKAQGVEVSEYASKIARERGLDVATGTLENVNFEGNSFNLITFWDVVEHLSDPKLTISLAHKVLEKGGVIAINTPDSGSFIAKLLGKDWHLIVPPEHLFLFNQENLSNLLREIGFEILFIGRIGKKFTLQYASQIMANKRKSPIFDWVAKFLRNNFLGKLIIPFSLGDNFFILGCKK
ncbi:MAG: glycosyltransferase [Patescibacteria group bacterium]